MAIAGSGVSPEVADLIDRTLKKFSAATSRPVPAPVPRPSLNSIVDRSWAKDAADLIIKVYPSRENERAYCRVWQTVFELMAASGIEAICSKMQMPCKFCGSMKRINEPCERCGATK